jgi:sister-chromatid-cohesion protein PDS5
MDPLTQARVLAVKILTNRCLAFADTDSATQVAEPVFQLLWPLIRQHDEDSSTYRCVFVCSATGFLSLTRSLPVLQRLLVSDSQRLCRSSSSRRRQRINLPSPSRSRSLREWRRWVPLIPSLQPPSLTLLVPRFQDECFEVRSGFIHKLLAYLRTNRITAPRYNMVLFLVAHDPEDELPMAVRASSRRHLHSFAHPGVFYSGQALRPGASSWPSRWCARLRALSSLDRLLIRRFHSEPTSPTRAPFRSAHPSSRAPP